MKKTNVLAIGCGGNGNRFLNQFLKQDNRYTGIFMNTNLSEMECLEHFDRERRCFYIPNADGCGKDRDLAESYIKEEAPKFAEMIKKFTNQDHIIMMAGASGGTGSKAIILLSMVTKKLCPEKTITLVGSMPNIAESDIDFENAIDFWNEVIQLKKKGIITNIQLIDNNKLPSEQAINELSMIELDNTFNVIEGKIDSSDLTRYHQCNGYKVSLKLDNNAKSTSEAIDNAIKNSMYFIPENLECDVLLASINTNEFDINVIKDKFTSYGFTKFNTKTEGDSYVLLGGTDMPVEAIELVQEAQIELRRRKRQRNKQEDLIIRKDNSKKDNVESTPKATANTGSRLTSQDLNDLFADDSFWN